MKAVNEYEAAYNAELDKAAHWYRQECERKWAKKQKEGEEKRKQNIQSLTKEELTELCQRLLQEGVIEKPEEFATAVLQNR